MDSLFKISKINTYDLLIEGLEKDSVEYLSETPPIFPSVRNYTYSQSVTINTLTSITSDGTETFKDYGVVNHALIALDSTTFTISKDGLYVIAHIILPSEVWLADVLSKDPSALDKYSLIYYYNTTNKKFYQYINASSIEVTLETILATDATPPEDITALVNTIVRSDKQTFIMTYLNACFNDMCKTLLLSLSKACNKEKLADSIYNRDLIWMSINVIKYCLDTSQLYEAQRYLEEIIWCDALCNSTNLPNTTSNCGCNN